MALYWSLHPSVNNPPISQTLDINLLAYTNSIPTILNNGLNLIGDEDYPSINPGEASPLLNLGAGFTNLIVQVSFVNLRGKNRGTFGIGLYLAGLGTEYIIEGTPKSEYTTMTVFTDFNIDMIIVYNNTDDGVSARLEYGQGSLVVPPASGSASITNFKDLVNEIIANNALQDQATIDVTSKRIVGPTLTP